MTKQDAINYFEGSMAIGEDDDSRHHNEVLEFTIKALEQEPARKKGKWINKDASGYHFYGKCSECGQEFCVDAWYTQNMKFCPNCGAEMEESE